MSAFPLNYRFGNNYEKNHQPNFGGQDYKPTNYGFLKRTLFATSKRIKSYLKTFILLNQKGKIKHILGFLLLVSILYFTLGKKSNITMNFGMKRSKEPTIRHDLERINVPSTPIEGAPVQEAQPIPNEHAKAPSVEEKKPIMDEFEDREEDAFSKLVIFNELPASSVTCVGRNSTERVCLVRNLCYDAQRDNFFIVRKPGTFVLHGRSINDTRLLDLTSIDAHNKFYFEFIERDAREAALQNVTVHFVPKQTFVLSRFHRLNIMHTIHDDFLGLYLLHRSFGHGDERDLSRPFSKDNHLFFVDAYGEEKYDGIYKLLSNHPVQKRALWRAKLGQHPLCFGEAVVGNSKALSWYHYGFLTPQGPLPKAVDGLLLRDAADYMMKELRVPGWDLGLISRTLNTLHHRFLQRLATGKVREYLQVPVEEETAVIALFVRRNDRLLLNLPQVTYELQSAYGLPVVQVRMEDMDLREQILNLRRAVIAVGLHGSALILGMFLPPGALLVELFPFRVPASNYTPYKTMAKLPGMRFAYKSWVNEHPENNLPHPERTPDLGGIVHLPLAEQERINELGTVPPHLCCKDPVWLYRIYQDTRVHIPELLRVVDEGLTECHQLIFNPPSALYQVAPAGVELVECAVQSRPDGGGYDLHVEWSQPWNGGQADKYGMWVHQIFMELFTNTTRLELQHCEYGESYDLWIRPHYRDGLTGEWMLGVYSDKFSCLCIPGARAIREAKQ